MLPEAASNAQLRYYREQAVEYRKLAEAAKDPAAKKEFLELAEACEEAADKIDDCRASG